MHGSPTGERLESWKAIAVYLNRSVRTVHRWEKEAGLPVHRQLHKELGSVFAYTGELDAWAKARSVRSSNSDGGEGSAARPSRTIAIVALTSAVLAGAAGHLLIRKSAATNTPPAAHVSGLELISTFAGSHRWPALSPDGRTVAFISDASGTPQVWVKHMAGGEPVQITFGDVAAVRPRWSAQGQRIVYSRAGGGVWSVPRSGGESRQIVEDGLNADVTADGARLVFEKGGQVLVADGDGRGTTELPRSPRRLVEHYGDSWPTLSPDGESVAVFLGEQGRHGDYWILPADGGEPRRITSDLQEGGAPAWTPDGKALVVASTRSGSLNLWRVPIDGSRPEALTTGPGDDVDPVVAPNGRTLLFATVKRSWTVVAHDVTTGAQKALLETRTPVAFPRYSPTGDRIAFMGRNARGETQLFVMAADGANLTAVTDGAGELNIMPQWSGDGATLYFYQVRPTASFRRVSLAAGATREVAPWAFARQFQAAVEPRERRVVYSAVERGQLRQSRARDLETGSETPLPVALYEQRFSRDGRWIAGETRDHDLVLCEREGRQCRTLIPTNGRALTTLTWSG
ncbi:MAG TPA: hypothetical protein VFO19_12390, partial [Vicinamibacterales bacterium]|nr:hypothetical protein [Vicinamibacterales bacterium]